MPIVGVLVAFSKLVDFSSILAGAGERSFLLKYIES
ncbi:MAG: hypothetical protein UW79_C0004G0037 [Candidatus Yanofskybacteria bacterium GW2011_GWA2_44_9]|uniref:Uncharacterized protein n=1 Tax=Candidatus Yanofskybacteria bacterium GW2011_GWA2_44_9 TaxID=1619025 RepID=A0A0G1KGD6_9BACT|nr:MAG: hypothetical protein UW79_C0004G0037 [Candidatus Yanofskybacteria bacterium GW2011_GWA2_44_9]